MSEDIYVRLREHLDTLPGGYPATDSGVELKILKKLFTPEEARIAVELKMLPEPVSAIAARLGMDENELAEKLDKMSKEGSVMRARIGDQTLYMALQFVVGIYEFHMKSIDREFAELMEEYLPLFAGRWLSTKTKQLRVIPVNSAIEGLPAVASYDSIRELAKNAELISVARCICTKEKDLLGHPCERPEERCVQFGMAAQFYLENGAARQIDADELEKILKMGEENALVISPNNAKEMINFCMCCSCCCGWLRILGGTERPAEHVQSSYQAKIDTELCSQCNTCVERCQIDAIVEGDDANEVDVARCIGCGLCVNYCPEEAICLVKRADASDIPANVVETNITILKESSQSK